MGGAQHGALWTDAAAEGSQDLADRLCDHCLFMGEWHVHEEPSLTGRALLAPRGKKLPGRAR